MGLTMKLEGLVQEQKVVVMIDCGATHNFISMELVKNINLEVRATKDYNISM